MTTYADYVYHIVKERSKGMDAIYKDYIVHLVGHEGFEALHAARLIESCGSVNLRELYVLSSKKEIKNG